jgi:ABC-type sugar transport system substrate-binding protein
MDVLFRDRSRMRRPSISRLVMVLAPVVLIIVVMAALYAAGVGVDTSLGVAGLLFGLATLALSEVRERETPKKRVLFLGQEDEVFNTNILQGLRAEADARRLPYQLDVRTPDDAVRDPIGWQVGVLDEIDGEGFDAVVVLPSGDDPRLWGGLRQLIVNGVTVVVLDVEPPWELFVDQRLSAPVFVSSDFVAGGRMAGDLVAEKLQAGSSWRAVVCIGPDFSHPGVGRSSRLLYTVGRSGLIDRVRAVNLRSWDATSATRDVIAAVDTELAVPDTQVIVFCGDDRILMAVSDRGSGNPRWQGRVELVGYDGLLDVNGRYGVARHTLSVGTVDTQPDRQGRTAARALVDAYRGTAVDHETRLVQPKLVRAPSWG